VLVHLGRRFAFTLPFRLNREGAGEIGVVFTSLMVYLHSPHVKNLISACRASTMRRHNTQSARERNASQVGSYRAYSSSDVERLSPRKAIASPALSVDDQLLRRVRPELTPSASATFKMIIRARDVLVAFDEAA
jgi:nicotinamidase-related amidase